MYISTFKNASLSENSYFLHEKGEAVVIDPLRDVHPFLQKLEDTQATLKYILLTHFHADFVGGHQELAAKTGATILFGPTAKPLYKAHVAKDNEWLHVGESAIQVLHTPGHSLESTCYLLRNAAGREVALFSGDTLFIGDVGRPDIIQHLKSEFTASFLAGLLYDSLRNKILPLSNNIVVYPAHGYGSACGKNIGIEPVDTLGHQKKINYALNDTITRDQFVALLTAGLPAPPAYYPFNVLLNQSGCSKTQEEMLQLGLRPLSAAVFADTLEQENALIVDTRSVDAFSAGFIPGSVFVALDDQFSKTVGSLITDLQQPLLLVLDEGAEYDVLSRLLNIGYDNTIGYLEAGFASWVAAGFAVAALMHVDASLVETAHQSQQPICLLDVRRACEYNSQHITGSVHLPLEAIHEWAKNRSQQQPVYLLCRSGNRSATAASVLMRYGGFQCLNVSGGITALLNTNLPRSAYREPVSQL